MKKLADDLKIVNKEINALSKKLEQLSKKAVTLMKAAIGNKVKTKAAPKKKAVKKTKATPVKAAPKKKVAKKIKAAPAKKTVKKKVANIPASPKKTVAKKPVGKPSATPTSKVLTLMKRYKKGIAISKLKERSGLNDKQISNILHRASKEGKIKRVARGVYQLA